MIKYIHKKASIFIFQFISDITCFIQKSIYHQYITLPSSYHIIQFIYNNQGDSQYHWGALTPDYY